MKRRIPLFLLACFSIIFSWAQNRQVSGRVVADNATAGLGGVTVTIKGTNMVTATDNQGRYTISIPNKNDACAGI